MKIINNKSISILANLSRKELIRFEKFLMSPFFNNNGRILILFNALKKFHPSFNSPKLSKKNIYEIVYGKEIYSDTKFRKLFSDFYKLAKRFLAEVTLEEDRRTFNILLLDGLQAKSIDDLFEAEYEDALEFINQSPFSVTKFLHLHDLKWQYADFKISRSNQNKIAPDIFKRSEYLIFYFLCDMFIALNDINANAATFNYKHKANLPQKFIDSLDLKDIYKFIEENDFEYKEMFSLFYFAYMMNKDSKNNSYFFKLKKLFEENVGRLSKTFSMNFVILLLNYCHANLKISYSKELETANVELCDLIVRHRIYQMIDGYYTQLGFFQIFFVYLRSGNVEKSRSLLEDFSGYLHPSHVRNVLLLGESFILFEENKFREALSTVSKINTKLINVKIYMRKLLLKLDYELNDFDSNKEAIDNFRHFLKNNNQISELVRKGLIEFAEVFNDMVNIKKESFDEFKLRGLRKKAESFNDLLDRIWFQKKLEKLETPKRAGG